MVRTQIADHFKKLKLSIFFQEYFMLLREEPDLVGWIESFSFQKETKNDSFVGLVIGQ